MTRNIFIVNATQVVVSESNPQGLFSVVSGYPKQYDSMSYDGDIELTRHMANAEYYNRLGIMYGDTNANRVMKTVTLENAKGELLLHESIGDFPVPAPEPEPEPVEEPTEEPEEEPVEGEENG